MALIEAEVRVDAPIERVWGLVSDVDAEPKFWKGTKSVRNISREGNCIIREVTIAFRDKKCMQEVTLYPMERVEVVFTAGIIQGTKSVRLKPAGGGVLLEAAWDISLAGAMGMFTGMLKKHIRGGTEQALHSIKAEAEK